MSPLTLQFHLC